MDQFRQDNTEGFSDAELAAMNNEYYRDLAIAIGAYPQGIRNMDTDLVAQVSQSVAEAVLRRYGAA